MNIIPSAERINLESEFSPEFLKTLTKVSGVDFKKILEDSDQVKELKKLYRVTHSPFKDYTIHIERNDSNISKLSIDDQLSVREKQEFIDIFQSTLFSVLTAGVIDEIEIKKNGAVFEQGSFVPDTGVLTIYVEEGNTTNEEKAEKIVLLFHELAHAIEKHLGESEEGTAYLDEYILRNYLYEPTHSSYAVAYKSDEEREKYLRDQLKDSLLLEQLIDESKYLLYFKESFAEDLCHFLFDIQTFSVQKREVFEKIFDKLYPDIKISQIRQSIAHTLRTFYNISSQELIKKTNIEDVRHLKYLITEMLHANMKEKDTIFQEKMNEFEENEEELMLLIFEKVMNTLNLPEEETQESL
ncbi:MAG: hypothetical protein ACK4NC_04245 [Candidatus Gracilibacteria bacterium]